jgi:hypothetical protein
METALTQLLGGSLFGLACAGTIMAIVWFFKSALSNFFAAAADEFRSGLKINETRYDQVLRATMDFKARQLSEFYWPIYVTLQKDNAVWDRILDRNKGDDVLRKVAVEIEKGKYCPTTLRSLTLYRLKHI